MIPRWLPFVALFVLTVGWIAVAWTLKAMILDRRARRLAAEAAAARVAEAAGGPDDLGHPTHDL